jgi:hypothetical protein
VKAFLIAVGHNFRSPGQQGMEAGGCFPLAKGARLDYKAAMNARGQTRREPLADHQGWPNDFSIAPTNSQRWNLGAFEIPSLQPGPMLARLKP